MKKHWKAKIGAEQSYDMPFQPVDIAAVKRGDTRLQLADDVIPKCFGYGAVKALKRIRIQNRQRKPEYLPLRDDKLIPGSQEALDRMRFLAENEQPLFEY